MLAWRIDALEKEVRDLSLNDELTKLYNRRGFYLIAGEAVLLAQRMRAPYSVLFVDLDNLKQINDECGHDVGSMFLCEVAELLRRSFRESDVIGRIGGDEFVVAGQCGEMAIRTAAQRLEEAAERLNALAGRQYPFSISFGFVTSEADRRESLDALLSRADKAMYTTKQGKGMKRG
jgi:diguanylate cyclase (GGDEF)-like protein